MKHSILPLIISLTSLQAMSQEKWQNYFRNDEAEINYARLECHDKENDIHKQVIIFQFVNLTDGNISVNFNKMMWYGEKCIGCDRTDEQKFSVPLAPKQTVTGTCEGKKDKALYLVEKMLNALTPELTKFELADVTVAKTK